MKVEFFAYDEELTDYVEIEALSASFTSGELPIPDKESLFRWFNGDMLIEAFRIENIISGPVDYSPEPVTRIHAQPYE